MSSQVLPESECGRRSLRSRAIARKVLAGFILIPAVTLSLLAGVFMAYFESTFETRVMEGLASMAAVQVHRIDDLIQGESRRLALLTSRTQLRRSLRDHLDAGAPEHLASVTQILTDALEADRAVRELLVLDLEGRVIASTSAASIGESHRGRKHFEEGQRFVVAAAPALDRDGRLILHSSGPMALEGRSVGVLVVRAGGESLKTVVGDLTGLGQTGETIVTRKLADGRILVLAPLRFDPGAAMRKEVSEGGPLKEALLARKDIVLTQAVDYRGAPVLAAVHHTSLLEWGVTVKIDRDEALLPVGRMRAFLAAALLMCCAAASATGWLVARRLAAAADAEERVERAEVDRRLHESQKVEALGRMAAGVSHELGNLVMAIGGRVALLRERIPPDLLLSRSLDDLALASDRATGLIQQLKAFAWGQSIEPVVVNLNDLIHEQVSMIEALLGPTISLAAELAPDTGRASLDLKQIEMVLMNLAANARDAMPEGGRLTISTGNEDVDESAARRVPGLRAGSYVHLEVADTGVGMDEATRSRIFEPFYSTKPAGQGMGLGLALVQGIVQQSRGAIVVESEPGRGSRFRLYFPRAHPGGSAADISYRAGGRDAT